MVITKFKIFEDRGEGIEDEDLLPRQLEFDFDYNHLKKIGYKELDIIKDYVISIPNGEIIYIDDVNDLKGLIERRLVHYNKFLNCYTFNDEDIDYVKFWNKNSLKKSEDKYNKICKEYADEMNIVTGNKHVVGYIPKLKGVDTYYIIMPHIRNPYYREMLGDIVEVNRRMMKKYRDSVFTNVEKLTNPDVKYYGLSL